MDSGAFRGSLLPAEGVKDTPATEGEAPEAEACCRLRARLEALADRQYRDFSLALTPGATGMLGVRLPELRRLARELSRGDWRGYLREVGEESLFEEKMLAGLAIGMARDVAWEERLAAIRTFVPRIDNWAVCDAFCSSLAFVRKDRERFWPVVEAYAAAAGEYPVRFALVMALKYYAAAPWTPAAIHLATSVRHEAYYVRMAAAWAVAECSVHAPGAVLCTLREQLLDAWTHNKAIQKMVESRRIDAGVKALARTLKRPQPR